MKRLLPQGIQGRFTCLLIGALLFCNIAAALLFAREGTAFDREARMQNDMGRLVSLIGVLEETSRDTAHAIIARTNTFYTRFSLDPTPIANGPASTQGNVAASLRTEFPDYDIRVIEADAAGRDLYVMPDVAPDQDPQLFVMSIQIKQGPLEGYWLNSIVYPLPAMSVWSYKWTFFVPLIASLLTALVVGWIVLRQMIRPLSSLAKASIAAGRGDHDILVEETGPFEIREAATAFNIMQGRISEFAKRRRELVASIGHDLRTPITSLRLRAELVEEDALRQPMIATLDRMSQMTEELLDYARDGWQAEPLKEVVLTDWLKAYAVEIGVAFEPHADQDGGPLVAKIRPRRLRRALDNLFDNARRYGSALAAPKLSLALNGAEQNAIISVIDNGEGLPDSMLSNVIEPFVRAESSRNSQTGGVGLGLSIVRSIAIEHHGSFTLHKGPSGGLEARLSLPLA